MEPPGPVSTGKNRRTRSGCLPCRKRRRKCDETRPSCRACQRRKTECEWGLALSFHPSRSFKLSRRDRDALLAIEARRKTDHDHSHSSPASTGQNSASLQIVDDTDDISGLFAAVNEIPSLDFCGVERDNDCPFSAISDSDENSDHGRVASIVSIDQVSAHSQEAVRHWEEDISPTHELQNQVHRQPLDSLPTLDTSLLQNLPRFLEFDAPPFFLGQAVSHSNSPTPEPEFPLCQRTKVELILLYLRDSATWCETTDSDLHFSVKSLHVLLGSTAFLAAAMSLASRQRDVLQGYQRQRTLELYQYTIRLLLRHNPAEADARILATCTILCVYEMMGSSVSEWRRHLRGCAGLLRMRNWNGNSEGIVKTCFWAFARIDVWAAFNTDQTTLIPTDSWVENDSVEEVAGREDVDDYCNLIILIFARIINLLNTTRNISRHSQAECDNAIRSAWGELQAWRRCRFPGATPLLGCGPSSTDPFPISIFSSSSANCGNTFYHSGCILLLQTGYIKNVANFETPEIADPVWHAREIGGISVNNISHANWVNQIQPLYLAGLSFAGKPASQYLESTAGRRGVNHDVIGDEDEHNAEKAAILRQFVRIEHETGWKASDRAKELRVLWGWEIA